MRELKPLSAVSPARPSLYFLFFSTLALIVGLIVANVVQPGAGMNVDPATLDTRARSPTTRRRRTRRRSPASCSTSSPTTMVSALTEGSILQTLFVAILFGIALSLVGDRRASRSSTSSNG